jgi:hypothetical protein
MNAGIFVPLAAFAAVALIVALVSFAGLHDRETEMRESLGRAEIEHRTQIAELDRELTRLRQGAG